MTETRLTTVRAAIAVATLVALLLSPVIERAGTRDFVLVNKTDVEIHMLFVASFDSEDWEEDGLGVDTLPPGGNMKIRFKGQKEREWDLKVKDGDGASIKCSGLDLCALSKVTLRLKGKKAWADLE